MAVIIIISSTATLVDPIDFTQFQSYRCNCYYLITGFVGDDVNGSDIGGPVHYIISCDGVFWISDGGGTVFGCCSARDGIAADDEWRSFIQEHIGRKEVQESSAYADPERHRFCCQGRFESCSWQLHATEAKAE